MFFQIIDWLSKFIDLLNNKEKLSLSSNRKKIGKNLIRLYSLLQKIKNNAVVIRGSLEELTTDLKIPGGMVRLHLALGEQRVCLMELKNFLIDSKNLLDIYGEDCGEAIAKIANDKFSLINLLINLGLFNAPYIDEFSGPRPSIYIPKTFDLNDIGALKPFIELLQSNHISEKELLQLEDQGTMQVHTLAIKKKIAPHDLFVSELGQNPKKDEELINLLLSQIDNMGIIKRLDEVEKSLANIIKTNFKIEELF